MEVRRTLCYQMESSQLILRNLLDGFSWVRPSSPSLQSCLYALLTPAWLRYYTRLWTLKELVLARPDPVYIFIGRFSLSWDSFASATQMGFRHASISHACRLSKANLSSLMIKVRQRGRVPLSRLLIATISRGVTNPHDRIYALLGIRLEEQAAKGSIVESYTRPLSQTYTAAAAMIMETENSLMLLEQMAVMGRIGFPPESLRGEYWPSWVPRLDVVERR